MEKGHQLENSFCDGGPRNATVDHGRPRNVTDLPPPSNPYPGRATPAHPRAEALILLSLRIIRAKALVHYVYSSFPLSSHAGSADIERECHIYMYR